MSRLNPEVIALDKGLNLQTAKIIAPKGSVLDVLNYEQVDFQGQKRIEGYARYDGNKAAAYNDYLILTVPTVISDEEIPNTLLGNSEYKPFGIVIDAQSDDIGTEHLWYVAVINEAFVPDVDEELTILTTNVDEVVMQPLGVGAYNIQWATQSGVTPDDHYNKVLEVNNIIRERVGGLPGPIAGLHWFRDRLYAVAELTAISLEESEWGPPPPGSTIYGAERDWLVLDSYASASTDTYTVITNAVGESFQAPGQEVVIRTIYGDAVYTVATGFDPDINLRAVASLFESRSDEQVLEEGTADEDTGESYDDLWTFGWRFRHLGWRVNYEDGISLYGSLPSLNQNISGLGIQGPTSITGNKGKPTVLVQNVSIEGKTQQVNGWKSSQTPTTYDLDIDNITSIDGDTIYADAYLFWTDDSSTISSPGLTTTTLEARDASASVPVEVDP